MTVHAQSASFAVTRPVHVGRAHLVVRDLDVVGSFYEKAIGLERLEESASGIELGAGGKPLLTLTTRGDAATAPRNAAGLFHTAFLMPNRQELAHWLAHAAHLGIELDGASDHLVSEAIYLSDPEGNGIEIYRDRSHMEWTYFPDGTIQMDTRRLDLQALYETAPKSAWSGMSPDAALGHIHLQVGNVPEADRFYEGVLGLKKMTTYPGASFYSSGAYHHHVAANVWNSRNASARTGAMTGLQDYELAFNDQQVLDGVLSTLEGLEIKVDRTARGYHLTDPWSIGLTLVPPQT
ncbi:catechol 2,3-dioxygenase [Peteryoungia aggregata LMG 23059]|uniref:Catechol 2,3-dioxygenase n=1 Tax=Peteryoungia aggregata LMG 23059 TaxID=1368425 RepID=A0ABU0GBD1_9HYPH|nr:VOC family protein [Peteryoungia aggregata]MDQ0422667.1 catechol 2,3-dioxygenase [Peteryoungia aggregata LMG 23059]